MTYEPIKMYNTIETALRAKKAISMTVIVQNDWEREEGYHGLCVSRKTF